MLAGRPINLWLGLTSALSGAIMASAVVLGADPTVVATLGGVWQGVLGAAILLIANQPPTLSPGDTYSITTPTGTPNYSATVATPPASTKPVAEPPTDG